MPPLRPEYVNDPLFRRVVELERKVEQLAQRSNQVITRGALRVATDWEPTTPPRMRFGMLPDQRHAMALYDADGNELIRVGEQADGRFGQDVKDTAGNTRVQVGALSNWGNGDGDYGLAVVTPQGKPLFLVDQDAQHVPWSVLVFVPWQEVSVGGFVSADVTSYTDFMAATQLVTAPFFHWNVYVDVGAAASVDWQIQATIAGTSGWVTLAGANTAAFQSSIGSVDMRTLLGANIVGENVDYRVQLRRNGGSGRVGFRFNWPPVLRPVG